MTAPRLNLAELWKAPRNLDLRLRKRRFQVSGVRCQGLELLNTENYFSLSIMSTLDSAGGSASNPSNSGIDKQSYEGQGPYGSTAVESPVILCNK
jgi:hypothetical protein